MGYTKKHIVAVVSGLIVACICVVLSKTYRPYIYENHINDFHIADTISNWLAVPAATLFLWGIFKGRTKFKKGILYSVITFIIYEFILSATFDFWDIIATVLSGGITYLIYIFLLYSYSFFLSAREKSGRFANKNCL